MTRALLPLLLVGCVDKIVVSGETGLPADDTAGVDTTDDTGGGDSDTTTEPVYVNDFGVWDGFREFVYDSDWYSCDDTVNEYGEEITEGDRDWDDLHDLCSSCEHFYEVEPESDSACDGYVPLGNTWRGITVSDDGAEVHLFREANDGLEEYGSDDDGEFDGENVDYYYEFDYGYGIYVDVYGGVTFPLVEAE